MGAQQYPTTTNPGIHAPEHVGTNWTIQVVGVPRETRPQSPCRRCANSTAKTAADSQDGPFVHSCSGTRRRGHQAIVLEKNDSPACCQFEPKTFCSCKGADGQASVVLCSFNRWTKLMTSQSAKVLYRRSQPRTSGSIWLVPGSMPGKRIRFGAKGVGESFTTNLYRSPGCTRRMPTVGTSKTSISNPDDVAAISQVRRQI